MTIFQSIVLGIVQGFTEFLPVSSSAHLAIIQNLFHLRGPVLLAFDVVVHLGTLLALFIYFRKELFPFPKIGINYMALIVVATIPTVIIGLLIKKWMEVYFDVVWVVAVTLLMNSFILWSTWWARNHEKEKETFWDAIWIGIAQGIAILPGVSRSGATVTTALWLKIKPKEAVRFSFFISIPAILGGAILLLPDALPILTKGMISFITVGFLSSFVAGFISIYLLFRITMQGKFHYFAYYTFLLAILTFFIH